MESHQTTTFDQIYDSVFVFDEIRKSPYIILYSRKVLSFEQAVVTHDVEEHPQDMRHPLKYLVLVTMTDAWSLTANILFLSQYLI
jgi:hypothetical protein